MNTDIKTFGAVAGGITLNTTAMQAAIDECARTGTAAKSCGELSATDCNFHIQI